jgi:hypothetical protein
MITRLVAPLTLALIVTGCDLFVIGGGAARNAPIERSQRSAPGVVHLFKAELDSNNTTAATELMVGSTGRPLLAVEKYELADDLVRWRSIMGSKAISETRVDTLSDSIHSVTVTIDYVRKMQFSTLRTRGLWWITRILDVPKGS